MRNGVSAEKLSLIKVCSQSGSKSIKSLQVEFCFDKIIIIEAIATTQPTLISAVGKIIK